MHILKHIAVLSLLLFAVVACSNDPQANGGTSQDSATGQGIVALNNADGRIPDMGAAELDAFLSANQGKATMVMLWATWCPSCKKQIPDLEKLVQTHGDKVNVIAMSMDENKAALERYLEKQPMEVSVVWGDQQIARDHSVEAIPTLLIFDKSGNKIFGQPGVFPHSMLGAMADKLASE